jgi:hypothetical protein
VAVLEGDPEAVMAAERRVLALLADARSRDPPPRPLHNQMVEVRIPELIRGARRGSHDTSLGYRHSLLALSTYSASSVNPLDAQLAAEDVPYVIGRHGRNIMQIQDETRASVRVVRRSNRSQFAEVSSDDPAAVAAAVDRVREAAQLAAHHRQTVS